MEKHVTLIKENSKYAIEKLCFYSACHSHKDGGRAVSVIACG